MFGSFPSPVFHARLLCVGHPGGEEGGSVGGQQWDGLAFLVTPRAAASAEV